MGKRTYPCTPWGMPTYNVFGWQKPCYLLQDGLCRHLPGASRRNRLGELWDRVGEIPSAPTAWSTAGYEASAVNATFSSLSGFLDTVKGTLFTKYADEGAMRLLDEPPTAHTLVQIGNAKSETFEETRA